MLPNARRSRRTMRGRHSENRERRNPRLAIDLFQSGRFVAGQQFCQPHVTGLIWRISNYDSGRLPTLVGDEAVVLSGRNEPIYPRIHFLLLGHLLVVDSLATQVVRQVM